MLKYRIFEGNELYDNFVKKENNYSTEGLKDLKNRIHYFDGNCTPWNDKSKFYFLCMLDGNKIVGMIKFKVGGSYSLEYPKYNNWVSFVSVDKEYRNRGIAKQLIEKLFKFANDNNYSILQSSYSEDGNKYIKKHFGKTLLFAQCMQ